MNSHLTFRSSEKKTLNSSLVFPGVCRFWKLQKNWQSFFTFDFSLQSHFFHQVFRAVWLQSFVPECLFGKMPYSFKTVSIILTIGTLWESFHHSCGQNFCQVGQFRMTSPIPNSSAGRFFSAKGKGQWVGKGWLSFES